MVNVKLDLKSYVGESKLVKFFHEDENKYFSLNIVLNSDKFIEYQKNLFSEFFSNVIDLQQKNENFLDFKKALESYIKQFNTQLKIFQEKLNINEKIDIRGALQIVWDENYLAALIGETSLVIFRNNGLETVIVNELDEEDKIDIFAEIIEGELENNDVIVQLAIDVSNYLSDEEIKELINVSDDIIFAFEEVLKVRIQPEELGLISVLKISFPVLKIEEKRQKATYSLIKYKELFQKYKYPIVVSISLLIVLILVIGLFSYISSNPKTTVTIDGQKLVVNLDDIKRQIDAFSKLKNTNTDVAKQQYKQIMAKLNELEKSNIQVLEVKELKKKMEQLYYKGFHINIVSEKDGLMDQLYQFSANEISQLSGVDGIAKYGSYLAVWGNKGVLLGIIDNKTKGILQKLSLPNTIKTCVNNLGKNGLYCAVDNDDIYNFSKYGLQILKNADNSWPKNDISLGVYGINKLYVLTKDPKYNNKNSYIVRYVLKYGNNFGAANPYVLSDKVDKKITKGIFTGSTLAIDGTFLIWTKEGLVQMYRKNLYDTKMYARIVKGWDSAIINPNTDFKGKVKVISYPNDKYVFLYDYDTNSLVVYLSTPYKTNDAYTTSYSLRYLYKVRFDLTQQKPIDVVVKYIPTSSQHIVYLLTNKGILKLNLDQFEE